MNTNRDTTPSMTDVQQILMETLKNLCDRTNPMDIDRARAVGQVAGVMVDTVKVGIDYLRVTGQDRLAFLEQPKALAIAPTHTDATDATDSEEQPEGPQTTFVNGANPFAQLGART